LGITVTVLDVVLKSIDDAIIVVAAVMSGVAYLLTFGSYPSGEKKVIFYIIDTIFSPHTKGRYREMVLGTAYFGQGLVHRSVYLAK
jgi:hypothetical protein